MIKLGNDISSFSVYSCQPKSNEELKIIIGSRISKYGPKCDLNDIDTSLITDMSDLFYYSSFDGDISKWNVRNVKSMHEMFYYSNFNGDISNWDVSNVEDMVGMFERSKFNGDISGWDVSNVKDMTYMFTLSKCNQDISNWNINKDCDTYNMFAGTTIKEQFKPKLPS